MWTMAAALYLLFKIAIDGLGPFGHVSQREGVMGPVDDLVKRHPARI